MCPGIEVGVPLGGVEGGCEEVQVQGVAAVGCRGSGLVVHLLKPGLRRGENHAQVWPDPTVEP